MSDVTHPAPCPGPDAHVTRRGSRSCSDHVKASNPERADRRGMPCRRDPSPGLDVCVMHGAELTWGTASEVHKGASEFPGTDTTEQAGSPVFYEPYARERAHLVKVCAEAIRAGVEERRVQLAEQQGAAVAEAIRRILCDLGLTAEQQTLVGEVVPRHLRAIAGGGE
jgi:hypothetical protein